MTLRTGDIIMGLYKKVPGWIDLSDEQLSKLKETMVEISADFIKVCEDHGINYMMGAGTALGAVRHKGFIPWDDDMDFHMPRADYMKFLSIAENELGDKYYIRSVSKGDDVPYPTIHIILKGTHYLNFADVAVSAKVPESEQGIYIDIFPYENVSSISFVRDFKGLIALFMLFAQTCVSVNESIKYVKSKGVLIDKDSKKALRLKSFLGLMFSFWSVNQWAKKIDIFLSSNTNNQSEWVACYHGKHLHKYTHLRKDLWGENRAEFEGHMWKVATNIDWYLTKEYSKDYMTPPPVGKRKIHPVFSLKFKTE